MVAMAESDLSQFRAVVYKRVGGKMRQALIHGYDAPEMQRKGWTYTPTEQFPEGEIEPELKMASERYCRDYNTLLNLNYITDKGRLISLAKRLLKYDQLKPKMRLNTIREKMEKHARASGIWMDEEEGITIDG